MICGIDPGCHGAIAFLNDDGSLHSVHDMPAVEVRVGKTKRTRVASQALALLIAEHKPDYALIEEVGGMTGQSASAAFTFGRACGIPEGVLAAAAVPFQYVTPQAWKKAIGLGSDKGLARQEAMRLFPANAALFARVKDDGRAEASLLARHAWLKQRRDAA